MCGSKGLKEFWQKYDTQCITILSLLLVGTCMHFVCNLFPASATKVLGVLFPVNETPWEHMKMLWYPFVGAGIVLCILKKDSGYLGGFVVGGVVAMLCMIGAFTFYQSLAGGSIVALDVSLFFVIVILCATLSFLLAPLPWCRRLWPLWAVVAVVVTAAVIYLTYHPGAGYLFQEE